MGARAWQVVGAKYVRLYAPAEAARLYPHGAGMHTNTSRVQPEDILATMYHLKGIDPNTFIPNRVKKPTRLTEHGLVVDEMLG